MVKKALVYTSSNALRLKYLINFCTIEYKGIRSIQRDSKGIRPLVSLVLDIEGSGRTFEDELNMLIVNIKFLKYIQ